MIDWSNNKLKFTSGIGTLCCGGLFAEVARETVPAWVAVAIALVPLVIFLFVHPNEMPRSVVAPLHMFASLYYFVLSSVLLYLSFSGDKLPQAWPVLICGIFVGAIPCIFVLSRIFGSTNDPEEDSLTEYFPPNLEQENDLGIQHDSEDFTRYPQNLLDKTIASGISTTLYPRKSSAVFLLLTCVAFVAIGIWMGITENWLGYLGAGFFGLGIPIFIIQLLPGSTYLALTPDGFTICSLYRKTTIPWNLVDTFFVVAMNPAGVSVPDMVGFNYVETHDRSHLGRGVAKAIAQCEGALPDTYGKKPQELADILNSFIERFRDRCEEESCTTNANDGAA